STQSSEALVSQGKGSGKLSLCGINVSQVDQASRNQGLLSIAPCQWQSFLKILPRTCQVSFVVFYQAQIVQRASDLRQIPDFPQQGHRTPICVGGSVKIPLIQQDICNVLQFRRLAGLVT